MTRAAWAERKVQTALYTPHKTKLALIQTVSKLLKAEHQRAVRVVQREIERVRKDQHSYRGHEKTVALAVLENILAALQKGRT